MKNFLIFSIFLIFSQSCFSQVLRLGFNLSMDSANLTGSDDSDTEGKLVSNSNLFYGFNFVYGVSKRLHFLLDYETGTRTFDNSKDIIEGDSSFQMSKTAIGSKFILFPRVAFRAYFNRDTDLSFEVNGSNQAMMNLETISYLSLFYDQIVFMGGAMYSGFKLGYDVSSSGDEVTDRTGTTISLFGVFHGLSVDYEIKSITKSNSSLDFEEKNSRFIIKYLISF